MRYLWLLPLGALSACMGTQDVSLGELLGDAGSPTTAPEEPRRRDETPGPTGEQEPPEPEDEEEEEHEPRATNLDAGAKDPADASDGATDAARANDAASNTDDGGRDAGSDAGRSDAGDAGDAASLSDASDAGSVSDASDAGDASDGNVPLICIVEPWHCR